MKIIPDWRWSFRLLQGALRELRVRPMAVIHVGAHHGEEVPTYLDCGFEAVTLVEADPERCAVIAGQSWINDYRVGIINRACGQADAGKRVTFHRTTDTAFSGLRLGQGRQVAATFPVDVVPIAAIQETHPGNVLVVDTQGTELDAITSADLAPLDLIITETQLDGPGAAGAHFPALEDWARMNGWEARIQWRRDGGWSDTLLTPRRLSLGES